MIVNFGLLASAALTCLFSLLVDARNPTGLSHRNHGRAMVDHTFFTGSQAVNHFKVGRSAGPTPAQQQGGGGNEKGDGGNNNGVAQVAPLVPDGKGEKKATDKTDSANSSSKMKISFHHQTKTAGKKHSGQIGQVGWNVGGSLNRDSDAGGDCHFNWAANNSMSSSYTLGLTKKDTKTPLLGLGGGYVANKTMVDVGSGLSFAKKKANFHLSIGVDGSVKVAFDANTAIRCFHLALPGEPGSTVTCSAPAQ